MSRGLLFSVTLAAACAAVPLTLGAEEPKIIATVSDTDPYLVRLKKTDSGVVIRSAEELVALTEKAKSAKDPAVQKAIEAELAKFLKVESIDWSKQMVLVAQGHPSHGERGSIKFDSPKVEGKLLGSHWKQEKRAAGRPPYYGPPMGFALVERFEGGELRSAVDC